MTWVSQVSVSVGATLDRHDDLRRLAEGHDPATRAGARDDERRQVRGPGSSARCAAGLRRARYHAAASRRGSGAPCCPPPSSRRRPGPRLRPCRRSLLAASTCRRIACAPGRCAGSSGTAVSLERPVRSGQGAPPDAPRRRETSCTACGRAEAASLGAGRPGPRPKSQTARAEQGLLPKVMSTARGAWSVTASASDALLAHVVPQIP